MSFETRRKRLRELQAEVKAQRSRRGGAWTPLAERLIEGTRRDDSGCLIWTGPRDDDGYGKTQHKRRKLRVHRLAWFLHNGPIPEGLLVLHNCDVPSCCEVSHLRTGTQLENMADRDARRANSQDTKCGF